MEPKEIARIITENIKINNGLIYEDAESDVFEHGESLPSMDDKEVDELMQKKSNRPLSKEVEAESEFKRTYGFSIITKTIIEIFKKYARPPVYDLMAGTGWLVKCLNDAEIKTYGSDIQDMANVYGQKIGQHTKLETIDALSKIAQFKKPVDIILGWPPCDDPIGYKVLKALPIGSRIFYFGEGRGGCVGDERMHNYIDKNCKLIYRYHNINWMTIHDQLFVLDKVSDE